MSRRKKLVLGAITAALATATLVISRVVCLSAWVRHAVTLDSCPDGALVPGVSFEAYGLRRGAEGYVRAAAVAYYSEGPADAAQSTLVGRSEVSLSLLDGEAETPLAPAAGWRVEDEHHAGAVSLPEDLRDGEYRLRVRTRSPVGDAELLVPLEVLAPAKVHVLTDRPLYQPGDGVRFRAVILRARDLAPLDGRPGRFRIVDPAGETVLDERAPAGAYGVAAGDFPLDPGAPTGTWQVRYESGAAAGEASIRVEPFVLPRFSIQLSPDRPYYLPHEAPKIRGRVTYSSGAPVRKAEVRIAWQVSAGDWPPPSSWLERGLPESAVAGDAGEVLLELPPVPADIVGRAQISGRVEAIDAAGDRVASAVEVLMVKDAIAVEAITELADGLVAGFNNRMYLRVTRPSGEPLAGASLVVKRAWDPYDEGERAETDEDGVAALQIDPGPPVNVVVPPMPIRPAPRPPKIERQSARDLVTGEAPTLADRRALDALERRLELCARFAEEEALVTVGAAIDAGGRVASTTAERTAIARCLEAEIRTATLPPGSARVLELAFTLRGYGPRVGVRIDGHPGVPPDLEQALGDRARDARSCLPPDVESGSSRRMLVWHAAGEGRLEIQAARDPTADAPFVRDGIAACMERALLETRLPKTEREQAGAYVGFAKVEVIGDAAAEDAVAEATTFLGYELSVAASRGKERLGETKLLLRPGSVPPLRLRATPVVAAPGDRVTIAALRGPGHEGELPEKVYLEHEKGRIEGALDPKSREVSFVLPADAEGWFECTVAGARALVFVPSLRSLSVEITPERERYAPGETARLGVITTAGGAPAAAAVGLFGVDQSLGQLAPLPGPEAMAGLREAASMSQPAFGVLDARMLAAGAVKGKNAGAALVLKVAALPTREALDVSLNARGETRFDPLEPLLDRFYTVLTELHEQVRRWEESAPETERMEPPVLARLWDDALSAAAGRGEDVKDAFGRPLALERLPDDLLALTDPRQVVLDGTRLSEDVEDWVRWVRSRK